MKTAILRIDAVISSSREAWRLFKLWLGNTAVGFDHWLNEAEQIGKISSHDIRVVGASLRKLPPAAATPEAGGAHALKFNLNALRTLRQERNQPGRPILKH
jgi:hypothetical protein